MDERSLSRRPILLRLLQALIILVAGWWVYQPALHGDWIWDDTLLISGNRLVQSPDGWWIPWLKPDRLIDYQPITVTVEWLAWHVFGHNTFGYHLLNLGLHLISALLVWRLLGQLGVEHAWLGGLIFAIHPALVESVAWMAELKNTLSLPPFLLSMLFYLAYDRRRRVSDDYYLSLGFFIAAMLAKTTMAMFPVVILLYAWWKRDRIGWRDTVAAIPFFAVSLIMGIVTLWFLNHHALGNARLPLAGPVMRVALAGTCLAFYFSKFFLPLHLMPSYPQWTINLATPLPFLPWLVLAGVSGLLWTRRATWGRYAVFGLGFFLINLLPFAGFTPASYMSFTWVMDHNLYIPSIGLIGLVVAGGTRLYRLYPPLLQPALLAVFGVTLLVLMVGAHRYSAIYINSRQFWTYRVEQSLASEGAQRDASQRDSPRSSANVG